MLDLWYKTAVLYCLDVETYMDSNGDGIGDFEGLTQRLDYLEGLGITCIWLMPFYPTPNRDNGYDVMDYYAVDPRLGTLGDFVEFARQARERGMRIIVDLVVNHTSDQHPWFQAACQNPNSRYHNFYVWSADKPADADQGMVFPGIQESTWTYNETAGAYYFHRFYEHQPDLNIANPEVRREICKIMGFWLELGVSGFRLDAAPFLIELKGIEDQAKTTDPYSYLEELRNFLSWRRGDAILLAEANVPADQVSQYFGDGDRMQMLFNFIVNQHLILALATEDATPLRESLQTSSGIPNLGQWAYFVRNHDELTLDKLTDEEREAIATVFAPDRDKMWIFERGIRRRFPPMIEGNRQQLELAYSLIFTLPGTPVLYYGEEIGMGDDLSLPERDPIRTPMQWSPRQNGGFSTAPTEALVRPVITDPPYGYPQVNVIDERRDPNALLNWIERAIRIRKSCPEFGWGDWKILETEQSCIFAHRCEWQGGVVIAVHNLSQNACTVTLDLSDEDAERLIDLQGDRPYQPINQPTHQIELEGYGYRWFRVCGDLL